jgi:hypothetical protein
MRASAHLLLIAALVLVAAAWVSFCCPVFFFPCRSNPFQDDTCAYSLWSKWSDCTGGCGRRGHHARFRTVLLGSVSECRGRTMQVRRCTGRCTSKARTRAPRVRCSYDHTAAWTPCSRKCGGGVQHRTRLLLSFWEDNRCAPAQHDVRRCNRRPCRRTVPCRLSEWSQASNCSATCGSGTQLFVRHVTRKARHGGTCDEELEELRPCVVMACPVVCQLSEWKQASNCSATCGSGTQLFVRHVTRKARHGGTCDEELQEQRSCVGTDCPVDCSLSKWAPASNCSAKCGSGTQLFVRRVVRKAQRGGACDGKLSERRFCDGTDCPIDCILSDWTRKTECNATCGSGYDVWSRMVLADAVNGGECSKKLEETRLCQKDPCPKPCEISDWVPADPCDCRTDTQKWGRLYIGGDCSNDNRKLFKTVPCKCECSYDVVGEWRRCCNGTQSRVLSSPTDKDNGCPSTKKETRPCNGTCTVECSANTLAGCSMGCPWCPNGTSWSDLHHNATNLFNFRPLDAGQITRPLLGGRGRTRLFDKFELSAGERVTGDCASAVFVRQIVSHNYDPYTICDGRFLAGATYRVSGVCEGRTFFIAPCGVKFAIQ